MACFLRKLFLILIHFNTLPISATPVADTERYILTTSMIVETGEELLLLNQISFKTFERFREYVSQMNPSSIIHYKPTCKPLKIESELRSDHGLKQFEKLCKSRGITLIVHPTS